MIEESGLHRLTGAESLFETFDSVLSLNSQRGVCRNLRAKLYKESFEFVRQQRIHCLLEGAWFMNGIPLATTVSRDTLKRPTRPWRFLRLVGPRQLCP